MTREEIINHVACFALAVFHAEDALFPTWHPLLDAARGKNQEERTEIANSYLRAVAEEIVKSTPDDELFQLYSSENVETKA